MANEQENINKLVKRLAYIGTFFLIAAAGLQGVATNRYVATNVPGSAYPFDSWEKAGTNIIEVIVIANANNAGDMVFVSNGTYYLTNQISITANVIVTNFTGDRTKVIINGNYNSTTNRCFSMNHANAMVSGLTITNGYANTNNSEGRGGGVFLYYGTIKDCLITGNRSVVTGEYSGGGGGGGINSYYGTADSCSVVGNVAEGIYAGEIWNGGGGIALNFAGVATNCYVAYNMVTNNTGSTHTRGGGFWLKGGKILNCTIDNNVTGTNSAGAGILVYLGGSGRIDPEIQNCIISSNWASQHGGGIFVTAQGSMLLIRNCLITANSCHNKYGYGAGIYLANNNPPSVVIDSCTICSNRFDSGLGYGGGIAFGSTPAFITNVWNCIIYDNYAGRGGVNLYDQGSGKSQTAVVYSCTSPGSGFDIVGGITNSPSSFVDVNNGNYRLRQDSPCINKGTNRLWMTGATDRDGNPRIRYGTVDMGAYEYISPGTVYKFY